MTQTSFFVFMAGDNNLDVAGTQDIEEMLTADVSPDVNVIVQFDRRKALPWEDPADRTTKRFQVKSHDLVALQDVGETNTGDPKVLHDFLEWGVRNYPAERNIAVIWNHGGGIKDADIYKSLAPKVKSSLFVPAPSRAARPFAGLTKKKRIDSSFLKTLDETLNVAERLVCTDDTSRDFLDNIELKAAMAIPGKKFDIIAFDACLMSMYEVIYQLKDQADFIVGSEEIEPPEGWPYKLVLEHLSAGQSVSTHDLSARIVQLYGASYAEKNKDVTQSAVATHLVDRVARKLDDFAAVLLSSLPAIKADLYEIVSACQKFREGDYIDLYDFVSLCRNNLDLTDAKDAARAVMPPLESLVIANCVLGETVKDAHGVAMYFPLKKPDAEVMAMYRQMDFCTDYGNWLRLIETFHKPKTLKRG